MPPELLCFDVARCGSAPAGVLMVTP
jgi:hypothetical protein